MDIAAILVGYLVSWISKTLKLGAGATWPGEIALRIDPTVLSDLSKSITKGAVLVVGTNGKTTTSLMIDTILRHAGDSVVHNKSGANLLNGVVSAFLSSPYALYGKSDWGLFEVDENSLPQVLQYMTPKVIVLLNLFRDQLDRYGEVDAIAHKWQDVLLKLNKNTTVVVNADDPQLALIGSRLHTNVVYYGLEDPSLFLPKIEHATDTIYCPKCGNRLTFQGVYFSHLGRWACGKCGLIHPEVAVAAKDFLSPIEGVYNRYNTLAAALTGQVLGFNRTMIQEALDGFKPAFGRMETLEYRGKQFRILLSKNPTGFNESLRTVLSSGSDGPLVLVLNDRIPDGRDVSWIWDVDFENLKEYRGKITVSGDRAFDLAVRLKHAGIGTKSSVVEPDLQKGLASAYEQAGEEDTVRVLPTYSAMLEVRKFLTGKSIL